MTEGIPPNAEEYQQLDRTLLEKMLDKASSDPTWKQRFLEDSQAAMDEFPENRRLLQMYQTGAIPTIEGPPEATAEEYLQQQDSLWEKILERAASDPTWKRHLLDEPDAALREAGFPELERVEEMRAVAGEGEVRGQDHGGYHYTGPAGWDTYPRRWCCRAFTLHWGKCPPGQA
jgi:hypothetical protein